MDWDVIVVGAGPAGLMLAGELRLAGIRVIVLEQLDRPSGQSRGLGWTARTMEVFDQRGLLSRFGEVDTTNQGHFGGIPLDFGMVEGAHFGAKTTPQARTEQMLAEWVADVGGEIRRGHEVVSLTDEGDSVVVQANGPDGMIEIRAAYVVGCDGGRSTVRRVAGFDFPGTAATMEMFLADLRGIELRPRMIGETLPGGMVMVGHLGDGIQRIIVCERGTPPKSRTGPVEFAEVAAAWKRLTGEDISHAEPVWVSSFGDATRQVTEYRRGRVLLAGDAAHIHLPAGGQGMNVSIQDAVNLGWKLAAEVHGWAPPGLLDSYHSERHAAGARLLMNTQAQGLLFLSGEEMQPLRDLLVELMRYDEVSKHLIGMVSGLEVRYEVGTGDHPLLGLRMPNAVLETDAGSGHVYPLLHGGRGLLLDLADDPAVRATAAGWSDRVDTVTARLTGLAEGHPLAGSTALLVRPDGYVAWAAPGGADALELDAALGRWFGSPAVAADLDPAQLAGQLRAIADRAAVVELCERYLLLHDEGRFGESVARDVLTEDVELSFPPGTHRGIAGLDGFVAGYMSHWVRTHHHGSGHLVDLDGDRAEVGWNVIATHVHPDAEPPTAGEHFHLGGRFTGTAVRTPLGWRLRRLGLRVAWTVGTGAPAVVATLAGQPAAGGQPLGTAETLAPRVDQRARANRKDDDMSRISGRTALVTGSSRGIGRATAERLGRDGALVAVHYAKNADAARDVVDTITTAGGKAFAIRAELGVPGDIDQLFTELETGLKEHNDGEARLDILVNNAGVMGGVPPEETTPELFDQLMAVNAKAPFFVIQRALTLMPDGGRIVNISSGLTRFANPTELAYAMSKGAVEMLALHLARHLGPRGITVNSVAPGITRNDNPLFGMPEAVQQMAQLSTFNRVGEPADVADVIAFLVSDDARWVTGAFIDASGGTLLG